MIGILHGADVMLLAIAIVCIIVLMAMMLDLVVGMRKAKMAGVYRSSEAFKRTVTKFITYEGGILVAGCIDFLILLTQIVSLIGLDVLTNVPIVTILIGILLCGVEGWSIWEKAEDKQRNRSAKIVGATLDLLTSDKLDKLVDVVSRLEEANAKLSEKS